MTLILKIFKIKQILKKNKIYLRKNCLLTLIRTQKGDKIQEQEQPRIRWEDYLIKYEERKAGTPFLTISIKNISNNINLDCLQFRRLVLNKSFSLETFDLLSQERN